MIDLGLRTLETWISAKLRIQSSNGAPMILAAVEETFRYAMP
jgi:hypothetical protein